MRDFTQASNYVEREDAEDQVLAMEIDEKQDEEDIIQEQRLRLESIFLPMLDKKMFRIYKFGKAKEGAAAG